MLYELAKVCKSVHKLEHTCSDAHCLIAHSIVSSLARVYTPTWQIITIITFIIIIIV